jgi:hypothetical protein
MKGTPQEKLECKLKARTTLGEQEKVNHKYLL